MDYPRKYTDFKNEFNRECDGSKIFDEDLISTQELEDIVSIFDRNKPGNFRHQDYFEKDRFNIWADDSGLPVIYVAILLKHKEDKRYAIEVVRAKGW